MRSIKNLRETGGRCAAVLAVGVLAFAASLPCNANIVNGDFAGGLSGWSVLGDVSAAGNGCIGDSGEIYSALYQGVALGAGDYLLEFDVSPELSGDLSGGGFAFPDVFFASVYFTNDLGSFDLSGGTFDDAQPLFDADAFGFSNVAGVLSASPLGAGWMHFAYEFTNGYTYAIPAFEVLDLNFQDGDSRVCVDNVTLAPASAVVPEPASLTLVGIGIAVTLLRRKRIA